MTDYDRNELQRLIKQYQNDMMQQYPIPTSDDQQNKSPAAEEPPAPLPTPQPNNETDVGSLQVRVSTENRAVPLPGAVVTVTRGDGENTVLVRTMVTDESGLTPLLELATKERALSLSPGNAQPFTPYSVEVVAEGYYPKKFTNLPIYGGVVAVQSVSMLPLPEGGDADALLVYPQGAPAITQ